MRSDDKKTESRSLCKQLMKYIPDNATVCGYMPLATEVDIRPAMLSVLERRQTLYLPVFTQKLVYRKILSLESLKKGELGILEPTQDMPLMEREDADVVIVPGRAFAKDGSRLGRGAGGYDEWIAEQRTLAPHTTFIGVCFEQQIVREIPTEDHDETVDIVCTAREVYE